MTGYDTDNDSRTGNGKNKDGRWKDEEILRWLYCGEPRLSAEKIGDVLGCSGWTVNYWMDKFGIPKDPHSREGVRTGYTGDYPELSDPELLEGMYIQKGMSCEKMADEIGCVTSWVHRRLEYYNISTRTFKEGIELAVETGRLIPHDRTGESNPSALSGPEHPAWKGGVSFPYGKEWREKRSRAIERDDGECRACGISQETHREQEGRGLDVHHIRPARLFDEDEEANRLGNLVTLCRSCHTRWEGLPVVPQ